MLIILHYVEGLGDISEGAGLAIFFDTQAVPNRKLFFVIVLTCSV